MQVEGSDGDFVSYEIRLDEFVVSLVDDGQQVTVTPPVGEGFNIMVRVTRSIGGRTATTTAGTGPGSRTMTFYARSIEKLIDESDLAESEKRQARDLIQSLRLRRPTLPEIATLLVILDKSEPLRTQMLHWLAPFFR